MNQPTFVDCFAGAGGLSLGLTQAGLRSILAFDSEAVACRTIARNLEGPVREARIEDLEPHQVLDEVGTPDVVVGGPPCQGFSTQRRGAAVDKRNDLVTRYFLFALAMQPRVIVMENVPGVLGSRGATHMEMVKCMLRERAYDVADAVIDASAVGVPQRRRRALVVAWDPNRAKPFDFATFMRPAALRTVRDAIGDMPTPPHDFSEHPDIPNHTRVRMSQRNIERIMYVPEGGGRLDVPEELRLNCHRGSDHRHLDVYGRLQWDQPSGTITAMFDNFTRGRFAHPREHRNITNREGARLQSFPDSYIFCGAKKEVARQIGNAVPPKLGKAVGKQILLQLDV